LNQASHHAPTGETTYKVISGGHLHRRRPPPVRPRSRMPARLCSWAKWTDLARQAATRRPPRLYRGQPRRPRRPAAHRIAGHWRPLPAAAAHLTGLILWLSRGPSQL